MTPYFYKIQELATGKYYVGCQYGKNANPNNFFVTYFTSNSYVKSKPIQDFKVVKIVARPDARNYERRYLKRCYMILGKDRFCEIFINRNLAPGIINTPESIERANIKRRVSNSIAARKRVDAGTHNFLNNRYEHSKEWKLKISTRMKGDKNPSKNPEIIAKKITEEYRKKQAEGAKGNTNVLGYKWWTDGKINKRAKDCPGENFYRGTIKVKK